MKHILKYSLGCLMLAATSVGITSCGDDDEMSDLYSAIYPKTVTIDLSMELQQRIYTDKSGTKVLPMVKGDKAQLGYTITPSDVTFEEVNWTSNNPSVATVDQNCLVTAVAGNGEDYAIIQVAPVAFYSGSNIYGVLKVTVANELVAAQSISVSAPSDEVYVGETLQLSASILPADATYRTVKWSSSNEAAASVDIYGLLTAKETGATTTEVTITATSLDGAGVVATRKITVKKIVPPLSVSIDQKYSASSNYLCAINEKSLTLSYATVPVDATQSLVEWKSSDEAIATVKNGVVTYNQNGVFGDVTITATCPEGSNASIKLHLAEGLVRELYHDQSNYSWYNAAQSANGTSSSHVWSYGKVTVTTYKQNDTNQRGDFKCWSPKTWLHAGNYPIMAIRMDDALGMYEGVTARNITLDASGTCNGAPYSGGLDGNNNKWLNDYKCSDNSHVFIYNLATQSWATGGVMPSNALATFTTLQFKYADIKTLTSQITYNVYWVQTFKTIDEVKAYIGSEGLTYTIIK